MRAAGKLAVSLVVVACVATTTAAVASADIPGGADQIDVTALTAGGGWETQQTTIGSLISGGCPTTNEDPAQFLDSEQPANDETPNPSSAWTLTTILTQCLPSPLPFDSITGVEISRSSLDRPPESLSPADLETPSPYLDSSQTPLIFSDGTNVLYYRPQLTAADSNYDDHVVEGPGTPLSITVLTGPLLNVTITASQQTATPGDTVTFTASVPKGSPAGIDYTWSFDDAQANATMGQTVSAKFTSAFNYVVFVTATDPEGGGGAAEYQLTVGTPTPGPASKGTDRGKHAGTSPTRTRGHQRHGTGTGSKHNATSTPTTTTQATTTAGTPSTTGSAGAQRRATAATGTAAASVPASGPVPTATPAGRDMISGLLLGTLSSAPSETDSASAAGRDAAFSEPTGGFGALGAILAALAVLTPIALGAGRELRRLRSAL